jgi:hypothetical protein
MLRRFSRWAGAFLVALGAGCGGGSGGEDGEPSRLLALSFDLENRTDVRRNQPLVFSFSARLDPESVTLDTLQVFRGSPTQPTPVLGRYEVRGNRVLFHPAILPGDPNPLGLPINAFGFDDATAYTVALPGVDQTPPPLRTLRTPSGHPLLRTYTAGFRTGSEYLPEDPPVRPRFVRASDTNGNRDDDLFRFAPAGLDPADLRRELPSDVRVTVEFSEAMDPRSVTTEPQAPGRPGGSFRLHETDLNLGIAGTAGWTPDGRRFTFVPATPLANQAAVRRYLATITSGIRDLAGNPLLLADAAGAPLRPEEGAFQCRLVPGEEGPLFQRSFSFVGEGQDPPRDNLNSDADLSWGGPAPADRLTPQAELRTRLAVVEEVCVPQPPLTCPFLLPQPLDICLGPVPGGEDCNPCTPIPGSPPGGDSGHAPGGRVQLLFLRNEVRSTSSPANSDKLAASEAVTRVEWGPLSNYLFRTTYHGVTVRLGHSTRTELSGGLFPSFPANYDAGSPPVEVFASGSYAVPNQTQAAWFAWPQTSEFDYDGASSLILDVNVPDPRVNDPQATYQVFRSNSTLGAPRRQVGLPGQEVAGCGDRTVYAHRFQLVKKRYKAQTQFVDVTGGSLQPSYRPPVLLPSPAQLPGGTRYEMRFQGADTGAGGGATAWSPDVRVANGKRWLRMEIVLVANAATLARPHLDSIVLLYGAAP